MTGATPAARRDDGRYAKVRYAKVIVTVAPAHLDRPFDYRVPDGVDVAVGQQVAVTFSGRRRKGWVVGTAGDTDADHVRELDAVVGDVRWFDAADLPLFRWVADRYAGTLADVLRHALPARVAAVEAEAARWPAPVAGGAVGHPACPGGAWRPYGASALLRAAATPASDRSAPAFALRVLPGDDRAALAADLVARCLAAGRSALVLAPDPSSALPDAALAVADSGADWRHDDQRARYRAFLRGRLGHARVAAGERSAALAPLRDLGLVIVDDEANPAYKERRSPRHHTREVALARARLAGATCVLLTDLPSAPLVRLLDAGHVELVTVDRGTERERAPRAEQLDLSDPRPGTRRARFHARAARALGDVVRGGGVAVVLAARGGQGAALACRGCRRRLACPVCDGAVRPARSSDEGLPDWECPGCGWEGPPFACPDCGDARHSPLAAGAGRLANELARAHPEAEVVRMEGFDAPGPHSRPAIAVMTRGSVVRRPSWLGDRRADLVVLPDADAMLGRAHLDAAEDALRLWLVVGGWARRLLVQTREPAHPAVQALVRWDPLGFWDREAERRRELRYPPHTSLVRVVAPAEHVDAVAGELRAALPGDDEILGPDLDGALLVKSPGLRGTLDALTPLRHAWGRHGQRVRVDVDPVTI